MTWFGMGLAYIIEEWLKIPADQWDYPNHLCRAGDGYGDRSLDCDRHSTLSVAGLMCRTARRNAVSWRWPIVACGLVAALAATISVGYRLALAQNEGFMNIGINFESPRSGCSDVSAEVCGGDGDRAALGEAGAGTVCDRGLMWIREAKRRIGSASFSKLGRMERANIYRGDFYRNQYENEHTQRD